MEELEEGEFVELNNFTFERCMYVDLSPIETLALLNTWGWWVRGIIYNLYHRIFDRINANALTGQFINLGI